MPEIRGPHIPYKEWFKESTPNPTHDHMNWLEVERWAARLGEQAYQWNACLDTLNNSVELAAGVTNTDITPSAIVHYWHSTNGASTDFVTTTDSVGIKVPRDGVYSISALVYGTSNQAGDDCGISVTSDTTDNLGIRSQTVTGTTIDTGSGDVAFLSLATAGVPVKAGTVFWVKGHNFAANPVVFQVEHFSVTYEAAMGPTEITAPPDPS